ncbi:DUF423 domain-containing protein [Pleurocapsales cyanobacterium LEGE 06147]|nr:DUF423 domain-containing protein [Pleurocapsales cyanobacterium LEGE 06147]
MARLFLTIGAILAGLSVAAGAFASHALKDRLAERALEIWETGAKYQMYHALALLLIGLLLTQAETGANLLTIAGFAFISGIFLFSGSLYGLSLSLLKAAAGTSSGGTLSGIKWLGAITPLGGVAFLVGWGCLAVAAWGLK